MKFLTQALALAAMTFSSVEARKTFSKQDFEQAVADGKYDREKLLRNAVPYHKPEDAQRRAQDEADQANADGYGYESSYYNDDYPRADLTSQYKIQFNTCLTLETENYNLLMDNLVGYAQAGTITSVRNYVLFDVCDGQNCSPQTWMVDLLSFIEAVVDYGPSRQASICQACQTYGEEVCGEAYYYNGGANNGGRELYNNNNNNAYYNYNLQYEKFDSNMCSLCEEYECYYDDGNQQTDFESVEGWIAAIAECSVNEAEWQGLLTYSGWMCNGDGSGIEIGVFLDEYCRMYNKNVDFSSIMSDEDYQYFYQAQDIIPSMFTDIIECRDLNYVKYVDEDTYSAKKAGNNYTILGPVTDACVALFYGDFIPRSSTDCGTVKNWTDAELSQEQAYNNQYNNGNNNQNGQSMYQYVQSNSMYYYNNYGGNNYSWYTYDIGAYESLDEAAVCTKLVSKWTDAGYSTGDSAVQRAAANSGTNIQNIYNNGEASNGNGFWKWVHDQQSSISTSISSFASNATHFGNSTSPWLFPTRNNQTTIQTASTKLSPLEVMWIVLLSVAATAYCMHKTRKLVIKRRLKRGQQEKEVYIQTDSKGTPLIIS